jgi:menaquinone-9 beta-reductase
MSAELEPAPWQHPVDSAPQEVWDVLIVGAGPAGSIAAFHLAARGHAVLLLDKKRFPRNKTCGDGLLSDALRVLERVGLLRRVQQLGLPIHGASFFSPSRIECELPWGYLTLKRRLLDTLIARKAVDAGAYFCQGDVQRVTVTSNGLVACSTSGSRRVYHARVGVIATGANVSLPEKLGLVQCWQASGLAVRCYIRSLLSLDRIVISYDRSIIPGYAWIFPMGDHEYNVGCGIFYRGNARDRTNLKDMFRRFTTKFPLARRLLEDGEPISPLSGASLRCGLKGLSPGGANNLLAIGEAIGATFPATGEGIGKAMETAEVAAEVIHEALRSGDCNRLRGFPARLDEQLRFRYLGYDVAERWLSVPWLVDLVARRARTSKFLQQAIAGIINETTDPRTVFSLGGMIRSFCQ